MIRYKRLPKDIHQNINALTSIFANDPNIVFAYLFGGFFKGRQNPLSDIDIAVFLRNINKLDYLDLFGKITDILGTEEVALVILNTAPISLTGRILQTRKVLADKKPFLRHIYESVILRKYFDFNVKEKEILRRRYGIGG
ncbi:MAG: nucleotidyltransferase domain-containing protein [Nitrospirae bacterium]|nr:nucleotidyltransferase domain-containing protein [Nitrospirota bacterium]